MFGRDKSTDNPQQSQDDSRDANARPSQPSTTSMNARSAAMIGPSIEIKGTVTGNENLIIDGTVEGSVSLPDNDLTIGETGKVTADLSAKNVKVEGQVTGDITGSEKVVISKAGRVRGNIVAPRVTLEDGAKFKGSIDMHPGEPAKPAAKVESKMPSAAESKQEAS